MASEPGKAAHGVRYEPDEMPPWPLAAGLALQYSVLAIGGVVLTVAIVLRSAESSAGYLAWGAFGALLVSGVATILQARRVGRLGSGYVLMMGTSGAFIAVSVAALQQGGPGLLATLIIVSSLFQFLLAGRLAILRRILTPTVGHNRKTIGVAKIVVGGKPLWTGDVLGGFTSPVNVLGCPAISLPLDDDGTPPAAVQLIAPWWEEEFLLDVGELLERTGLVVTRRPPA